MKYLSMKSVVLSFAMILSLPSICKSQIDKAASQATDTFLKCIMIIDLPEARKTLNTVSWQDEYPLPDLIKSEKIYESMFDTENKNVKGYKRIISAQVRSKAKTTLNNKYMIIAYKNAKTGKWKVYAFSELTDVNEDLLYWESKLGDTKYVKDQVNYRILGFWYTVAGRFAEAKKAFVQAIKLNESDPDDTLPQSAFDKEIDIIRLITGGK